MISILQLLVTEKLISPRETTVQDAINNKQFSDTTVCPPVPSELLK